MMTHPRKKVLAAYQMKEANPGLSESAIERAIGVPRKALRKWLHNPASFDPYYDRIAVRRALAGDGEVYERLTYFESHLVVALLERLDTDEAPATARFPLPYRERVRVAIKRRRDALGLDAKPKHHKIRKLKLTPEKRQRVLEMRQRGVAFEAIAYELGISRSTVFRALSRAA